MTYVQRFFGIFGVGPCLPDKCGVSLELLLKWVGLGLVQQIGRMSVSGLCGSPKCCGFESASEFARRRQSPLDPLCCL